MRPSAASHWIEIDAVALRNNVSVFRSVLTPRTALAAVVKANAYGHGLEAVTSAVSSSVDWFAVHSADEARALRALGVRHPVLIMGFVPHDGLDGLDGDVHVVVSTPEVLESLASYRARRGVSLPVHLKVETGTHRQGIHPDRLPELCRAAGRHGLEVVGLSTHFANIEDTLEHEFARRQLQRFQDAVGAVSRALGAEPPWIHAACSAAVLLFRQTDFTLARVGIGMYGHWPSRETRLSWILEHGRNGLGLSPALTLKSTVGQINRVETGGTVGYGRSWEALRPTRLAVLPTGYADGYPRALGNRARVLVHGVPAPVVGRVCMNITMVDVTDVPEVEVGDEVILVGGSADPRIPVEELAGLIGTINYELLAGLSPAIQRILVDHSGQNERSAL